MASIFKHYETATFLLRSARNNYETGLFVSARVNIKDMEDERAKAGATYADMDTTEDEVQQLASGSKIAA